ncbi:MAG TPA: bifunctional YncE family protein/alkaline phosphatase family protein [Blastocatellia bacterium]|nr:bifunctional YncE family protein/alkaline phosphatase family protein [Blastocatellia bacterium]
MTLWRSRLPDEAKRSSRTELLRVARWNPSLLIFSILAVACVVALISGGTRAQTAKPVIYTTPLSTGVRLDPAGDFIDLGSMPLAMALAPGGDKLVVVLSGWREQGIQVVDLKSRRVTQTLKQDAAFLGLAFSSDGRELYVSGGNDDSIFCYSWKDGMAAFQRRIVLGTQKSDKTGSSYPAGLAVSKRGDLLYVAENVADTLAVVDPATSKIIQRFPTDHYPYAVVAAPDGGVYVSAWGSRTVSSFSARNDGSLIYTGRIDVGPHPSALVSNSAGSLLFAALASTDQIAVIDTKMRKVVRYLSDTAPAGPSEGSTPNALALSKDESKLYVAEADNNAVAVFYVSSEEQGLHSTAAQERPAGRVPVDWYPTAVVEEGNQLLVLNGKGHGSHANPDGPIPGEGLDRPLGYDLGQLNGTLRLVSNDLTPAALTLYSTRVASANGWDHSRSIRHYPSFRHVVYIIKENRTYDQVLGDLKEGDGDASLVFFGKAVSPNHHALALRFGLFDRFFTNAEVSSQGHIWSTAAYVTDYGEKTIPSLYSNRRADVDGEEIDEPADGFLWTLATKKGVTFRDYGEMVNGPQGWPVTQRELGPDICKAYPPFHLDVPDQVRADAWIAELNQFVRDGEMPALEVVHLPSDHTAGGRAGLRTPRAYMADNDLALGRIVEALSNSPFWKDTVVFVLEDDSQAGPDHVDSHRSPFFAISAYNRPGTIHRFANTTDVVAAIEDVLGLGHLSKFDYFSRPLSDVFAEKPDLTPYAAVAPEVDMNEKNPAKGPAAQMSAGLDFSAPDRVNDAVFNQILWFMLKGNGAPPVAQAKSPVHALQMSR